MDIKSLRVKLEISQQQLADYLLVGRTMLALMETGKKNIPFHVAKKLLDLENPDAQKEVPLIKPESLYKKWFIEDAMKARLHAIDKLKRRLYIERRTLNLSGSCSHKMYFANVLGVDIAINAEFL